MVLLENAPTGQPSTAHEIPLPSSISGACWKQDKIYGVIYQTQLWPISHLTSDNSRHVSEIVHYSAQTIQVVNASFAVQTIYNSPRLSRATYIRKTAKQTAAIFSHGGILWLWYNSDSSAWTSLLDVQWQSTVTCARQILKSSANVWRQNCAILWAEQRHVCVLLQSSTGNQWRRREFSLAVTTAEFLISTLKSQTNAQVTSIKIFQKWKSVP